MMKNNVLVSVVVPVFNREAILAETIKSVLRQTYSDIELLLVDDGSVDASIQIAEDFAFNDKRVKVIRRERQPKGAPTCRNIGLEAAQGDFIIFLDSDDLLLNQSIEKRVAELNRNVSTDFIVNPSVFFTDKPRDADRWWNVFNEKDDLDRFLLQDVVWSIVGPTWKKTFLMEKGLRFNEEAKTSQDWEFHLKALLLSPSYRKINNPDSLIRRGVNERISSKHFSKENQLNRINLIFYILQNLRGTSFHKKSPMLVSKLIEEFVLQMNSGLLPPVQEAHEFFEEASRFQPALESRINFVLNARRLLKISPILYKVYRRLFFRKIFLEPIYAHSGYRTPMSREEISQLVQYLN